MAMAAVAMPVRVALGTTIESMLPAVVIAAIAAAGCIVLWARRTE